MAKPRPRRIPSDDCKVTNGGETYTPHEGEWVEVLGGKSVATMKPFVEFARLQVEMKAAEGDPDEGLRQTDAMMRHYDSICGELSRKIVAWSWTDDAGEPLPAPKGRADVIAALDPDEVLYLFNLLDRGAAEHESAEATKNGSTPSVTTSSAIA